MKFTFLIFALCWLSAGASAQGYSRVNLAYTQEYYFNKLYVANDAKQPDPIKPKNTLGYLFSLEYERVTRYGLVFNIGMQGGLQSHNIDLAFNFTNFDSTAKIALTGETSVTNIKASLWHINPHILVGYRRRLNKDWAMMAKVGMATKLFIGQGLAHGERRNILRYETDDNRVLKEVAYNLYSVSLGDDKANSQRYFSKNVPFYQVYIGVEKQYSKGWVQNISIGLEAARTAFWNSGGWVQSISMERWHIPFHTNNYDLSRDWYYDRNISIGLRVGVGLWK